MRILYLAKHDAKDNEDEAAIAHALIALGHEVILVHENIKHRQPPLNAYEVQADLCLFHKSENYRELADIRIPKVFWYFDLMESDDPTLKRRCEYRQNWLGMVLPHCLLGFMTDGDFVSRDRTGKLRWLMQGADERRLGKGTRQLPDIPPILFTGMIHHGERRARHVEHLQRRWRHQFGVMGDAGPRHRKHSRELADILCSAQVVLAPNGPSTDRYWSNRVYLTCGFGGFLLHPYCRGLLSGYQHYQEIVYYTNQEDCDEKIDYFLRNPEQRASIAKAGYERTVKDHLYRYRVMELLKQVEERL